MASPTELTPQERLAISRKAIVKHMNRHHREADEWVDDDLENVEKSRPASHGALGMLKHAARVWWHRNPASAAVDLARPLLGDYASAHPLKLLGISVAIGAAVVVIRPWRMVSLGTLLIAAIKSSGLTSAMVSMLSSAAHHPENTGTTS